ncbi:MAG: tetratricopeptide repeat protein [Rickettsiales bacterium]|jgi:hypothetical protein|nr:tetratricopeptide repeat protein [Rickettsiales bacterium]
MATILERFKKAKVPQKTLEQHAEDALYREVSEEVKAQEAYDFIKKHAKILITVAAVVLIIVIGVQIVKRSNAHARLNAAAAYESAMLMLDNGNPAASSDALMRVAKKSSGGMSDLALLNSARIDLQTGSRDAGIAKLERLANKGATRDFRDIALINLAVIKADSMKAPEFEKYLAPVQTKRSPFYYTGLLFVAQKYLSENDYISANAWLDKIITDKEAPAIISSQAESLR